MKVCDKCGSELGSENCPWEDWEFERTRWLEEHRESDQPIRLVLYSPVGDGALFIRDEITEAKRSRARVVDRNQISLTPDEVVWLFTQLQELIEGPPGIQTNVDDDAD